MLKKILLSLIIFSLVFMNYKIGSAESRSSNIVTKVVTQEPVNIGNKICPVSGEKIEEATKVTYEYKGKIYNFCCVACIEEFKNDPDKYIQIVNEEMRNN